MTPSQFKFGLGMDGYGTTPPAGAMPDVGQKVRGHWMILQSRTGHWECYKCDMRYPETAIKAGLVPDCEGA